MRISKIENDHRSFRKQQPYCKRDLYKLVRFGSLVLNAGFAGK